MKKFLTMILATSVVASALVGCNYDVVDTTFSFERCVGVLPDGTIIEGRVDSWKDYEDGDQIQVEINGKTYLFHANNIVLISE